MRLRLLVSEAWRSLGANVSTTFAAMMTVLVGMFLLGLFIALGTWTRLVVEPRQARADRQGRLQDEADRRPATRAGERRRATSSRRTRRSRRRWKFVSKEEALERMKKRYPELVKNLPYNPLPDSLEVTPTKGEYLDAGRREPASAAARRGEGRSTASSSRAAMLQVAHVIEVIFTIATAILLDRRDAADREHDPALDLLAAP